MISLKILNFVNRRRKRLCKKKSLKEKRKLYACKNAWILIFWQQCNSYEMNLIKPKSLRFHTAQVYCGWELTYFFVILFFLFFFCYSCFIFLFFHCVHFVFFVISFSLYFHFVHSQYSIFLIAFFSFNA